MFLYIILGILSFVIVRVFVLPILRIRYYTKQGALSEYFPLIGNLYSHYVTAETHGDYYYKQKRMKNVKNPPRFKVTNMGSEAMLLLYDTQLIKAFYSNPQLYVKKASVLGFIADLLGNGMLLAEGAVHKRHRKIISNVFHFELLKSNLPVLIQVAKRRFDEIEKKGEMKNIRIMDEFQHITGEVVGTIFFGQDLAKYTFKGKALTTALADLIIEVSKVAFTFSNFLFGPKLLKLSPLPMHRNVLRNIKNITLDSFRDLCIKIVQEKKADFEKNKEAIKAKPKKDMLEHLFLSLEENSDETLTERDIVDEFITFFLAGMDTTGHLTAMAVHYLTEDPELVTKLRQEISKGYKDGSNVTIEDLQSMEVMNSFFKEALRYYTPAPGLFPRVAVQDHYLNDIHVKKGTLIEVEFMSNNFSEEYFEDPFKFNPYRFMNKTLDDPFAFIPFSSGSRNCIGQHLANIESKALLCEFLRRYDFKLKEGYKLKMTLKFLHEPVDPLEFDLTKRV